MSIEERTGNAQECTYSTGIYQVLLENKLFLKDTLVLNKNVILAYDVTNTCTHSLWNLIYLLLK